MKTQLSKSNTWYEKENETTTEFKNVLKKRQQLQEQQKQQKQEHQLWIDCRMMKML